MNILLAKIRVRLSRYYDTMYVSFKKLERTEQRWKNVLPKKDEQEQGWFS